MGLNNEYADYVNDLDIQDYSGDDMDDQDQDDDPQSWQDWNSEHLLNMWTTITEYFGYQTCRCTFNDWNTFVYNRRHKMSRDAFYVTEDYWLSQLYDQLVSYCEVHELSYMTGIPFSDFENFIYYREV